MTWASAWVWAALTRSRTEPPAPSPACGFSRRPQRAAGSVRSAAQLLGDHPGVAEHQQLSRYVFQFADVAGPGVGQQGLFQVLGDDWRSHGGGRVLLQEVVSQRQDLVLAFAERRHIHTDDVQAIVEILAESLLLDGFLEVAMGGCQHANVDPDGLAAA